MSDRSGPTRATISPTRRSGTPAARSVSTRWVATASKSASDTPIPSCAVFMSRPRRRAPERGAEELDLVLLQAGHGDAAEEALQPLVREDPLIEPGHRQLDRFASTHLGKQGLAHRSPRRGFAGAGQGGRQAIGAAAPGAGAMARSFAPERDAHPAATTARNAAKSAVPPRPPTTTPAAPPVGAASTSPERLEPSTKPTPPAAWTRPLKELAARHAARLRGGQQRLLRVAACVAHARRPAHRRHEPAGGRARMPLARRARVRLRRLLS